MGTIKLLFILLVTGLLPAVQAANSPAKTPPPAARSTVAARPAGPSDAELQRSIQERFNRSKIRSENFQVAVRQGIATISGKTNVIQRKGTATRLAKLAGARAVENKIEVSAEARERAARNLESGRRRAQIKRSEVTRR
ncbi:MAG: BON domain-containing protein [Bryobacterales bacterium]|nr:BON domain-containing protein [Bryobacterales bacterium]